MATDIEKLDTLQDIDMSDPADIQQVWSEIQATVNKINQVIDGLNGLDDDYLTKTNPQMNGGSSLRIADGTSYKQLLTRTQDPSGYDVIILGNNDDITCLRVTNVTDRPYTISNSGSRTALALLNDIPSIINNLTSTSTEDALSANQGRLLKGLIDDLQDAIDTINGKLDSAVYYQEDE